MQLWWIVSNSNNALKLNWIERKCKNWGYGEISDMWSLCGAHHETLTLLKSVNRNSGRNVRVEMSPITTNTTRAGREMAAAAAAAAATAGRIKIIEWCRRRERKLRRQLRLCRRSIRQTERGRANTNKIYVWLLVRAHYEYITNSNSCSNFKKI